MPRRPKPHERNLDWSDLQAFAAVCATGSISRASARLGTNHSTVLRRVAALERALATPLFDRSSGRYVRTAAGEQLLVGIAGMAARIDESSQRLEARDDELSGEVRLTTTDTLARALLMPLIEEFCTRHPAVTLRLSVDNRFLSLTRREADVALRGGSRPPGNLHGRRVGDIQTAPYASRAYLQAVGRRRKLEQLAWVAPDESLAHLEQAKWIARVIAPERIVLSIDTLVGMVHAVEHGIGAGMLLCPLADACPGLVRLAEPEPELDTQVWVLVHPDLRQNARVRAFAQFLFERLSSDPRLSH